MAYTSHGHQIVGTIVEDWIPTNRARCGGPGLCKECSLEAAQVQNKSGVEVTETVTVEDVMRTVKGIIRNYVDRMREDNPAKPPYTVVIVWFTRTGDNWKAMAYTTHDGMYFELVHEGDETSLDVYKKVHSIMVGPHGDRDH